jgi:hypothetical protein
VLRDRFVALESSWDGGEVVTKPLVIKGRGLRMNASARFGEIGVEALDLGGKVVGRSRAVRDEGLDLPVEWEREPGDALKGAVILRVRLKNARVFSLWSV